MTHTIAKIFGWSQFALNIVGNAISTQGAPHGAAGWLSLIGSLILAGGIHAASSTDGSK
jgi:hypothetical protein